MRVPEQWLRTMVNPPIDSEALANALTMAGLEVEDALPLAPEFSGVVIGRVAAVAPHPDADRLRVCTVDIGRPDLLQIVCGAPNVHAGLRRLPRFRAPWPNTTCPGSQHRASLPA